MLQRVKQPRPHRDRQELSSWLGALAAIKILETRPDATLPALCHEAAAAHGARDALIGEQDGLSYQALSERLNRYANWALAQALPPGETVCLLMPNCAEYAAIWLGLSQTGCTVALLNTTLAADGLVRCIQAAASNILIFSSAFLPVVAAAMDRLAPTMQYWMHGDAATDLPCQRVDLALEACAPSPPPLSPSRQPTAQSVAVLVYTSGTTGLPKATKLTHGRLIEWSCWFAGLLDVTPEDRMYNCLPLYHSTGGIVAIGAMLVRGAAVVIRERFSATRFWDDIAETNSSMFMYIGELCRYLTLSPSRDRPPRHRLRLCCGNGLERGVWKSFQSRFNVPRIVEFYAATEGSVSLYNCAGKPGAIGHVPAFLAHNFPVALVRTDPVTGEIFRDADGLCKICEPNEPGEALGRIARHASLPSRSFDGYTDDQASAQKIVRDVFTKGDAWFRTGDLMRRDADGFYYFVERLGDTFRWKGENVSAEEVSIAMRACPGISDALVFGVAIPGFEGRAGMAAITINPLFKFDTLLTHLKSHLPSYARPIFIRICETLEVTGTFRHKKDRLAREGFTNAHAVWFYDRLSHSFTRCDDALRQKIEGGKLRL